jgi:hypothetical protein
VRDVVLVSGATSRTRIVNVPDSAAPLMLADRMLVAGLSIPHADIR